jgi:hypothetical protein
MACDLIRARHGGLMLHALRSVLLNIGEDAGRPDADRAAGAIRGEWPGEDPRGAMLAAADLLDLAGADLPVFGLAGGWAHDLARELRRRALGMRVESETPTNDAPNDDEP